MSPYISLGIAAVSPAVAAVIFALIPQKQTRISPEVRQLFIGIMFGVLGIFSTRYGIPIDGAIIHCRDSAVLIAGLMFGAPAGITAGLVSGIWRFFVTNLGELTRVSGCIATVLAGFYAAALRKFMFDDKRPDWLMAGSCAVVMEVIHLTIVFLLNMEDPEATLLVVQTAASPMIVANGLSLLVTDILLSLLSGGKSWRIGHENRISQTVQKWLFVTVVLAFFATSFFVFRLQDAIADAQKNILLENALNDATGDIRDSSNNNLLNLASTITKELKSDPLEEVARRHDVAEVNIVNSKGIIVESSVPEYIGYDMASGEQSAEFLRLLNYTFYYVQDYGPTSHDASVSRKYAGVRTDDGFVQIGCDADQIKRDIDNEIIGSTKNRHVGRTGYIVIVDQELNIVSAPETFRKHSMADEIIWNTLPEENEAGNGSIDNEDICYMYRLVEGYYILAIMPEDEVLQTRDTALYVNSFMEILLFAALFVMIYMLIKRVVVNKLREVNRSLAKITGGDLDEVVNVRSNTEFASLSDDINQTVSTLKQYIKEASARIDAELEFAKNIQASALPDVSRAFGSRKDFDIFASMDPAKEVGGDFYDSYLTDHYILNLLVADVSGKGIPAAMFMMRAKTELKSLTETGMSLDKVFTNSNNALCEGNDADMFVTAWQARINLETGHLWYANAGHNPPVIKRGDSFSYLKTRPGLVLAGIDGMVYQAQELDLAPGDILFLYTDGVTEATNGANELFGEDRLLSLLNSREFADMKELCETVKEEIDRFVGDAPQFDDITMLAFRYIGTPPCPSIHIENAEIKDISRVTEFVEAQMEAQGSPMRAMMQVNVAIDEIVSNIVHYGYKDGSGPITVKFIAKEEPKRVYLQFIDEGVPYNPVVKEDPDLALSLDEQTIGGLGIYMVKKTMDDMKYEYENGQNILTIMKNLE